MPIHRCRTRISRISPQEAAFTEGPYSCAFWRECRSSVDFPQLARSVHLAAWVDAQEHKWTTSGEHCFDRGDQAINEWYEKHHAWFCRHLLLEHVTGVQHWQEFGEESYAILEPQIDGDDPITGLVLDKVFRGAEAFNLTWWKLESGLSPAECDQVTRVLALIDINRARVEPIRYDGF